METSKQDIVWINTVKTVGIFLVYLCHTEFYKDMRLVVFHSIYNPFFTNCFFFVSGYLLLGRQWKTDYINQPFNKWYNAMPKGRSGRDLLLNIIFRIVFPTILFSSLLFIPKNIFRGDQLDIHAFLHDTIFGGSIWFTCSLAVSQLIIWLLLAARIKSRMAYIIISIFFACVAIYFAKDDSGAYGTNNTPWFWKGGFIATLYLIGGGIYYNIEQWVHRFLSSIYMMIFGLSLYIILLLNYGSKVLVSINVGILNLLGAVLSFVSILLVIELCRKIPYNKAIEYIGRHTLILYFMSGAIPNVLAVITTKYFGANICTYIVCTIVSFIIAVPVTVFVNKYLLFLTDIRKIRKHGL